MRAKRERKRKRDLVKKVFISKFKIAGKDGASNNMCWLVVCQLDSYEGKNPQLRNDPCKIGR